MIIQSMLSTLQMYVIVIVIKLKHSWWLTFIKQEAASAVSLSPLWVWPGNGAEDWWMLNETLEKVMVCGSWLLSAVRLESLYVSVVRLKSLCIPPVSIVKASVDSLLVFCDRKVVSFCFKSERTERLLACIWGNLCPFAQDHLTGDIM